MALNMLQRLLEQYSGARGGLMSERLPDDVDAGGIPAKPPSQVRGQPGPAGLRNTDEGVELLLGQGVRRGGGEIGGNVDTPYRRLARTVEGGGLMEGHDYGGGKVNWFKRKNPAALEAAARLAFARQGPKGAAGPVEQQIAALSPEEQQRVRYLLGR
jgi:hypothetical protein